MKNKFVWFGLVAVLLGISLAFASARGPKNPGLMHMHRREFIAAGIAQGMAANGAFRENTPDAFSEKVLQYTDALMRKLDNDKEDNTND